MRLEYTALDSEGQLVRGVQEVPSRAALSEILVTRQLDLLQVRRCWLPQRRARRPRRSAMAGAAGRQGIIFVKMRIKQ